MDILHYLKSQHDSIRLMVANLQDAKTAKDRKLLLEPFVRATQVYLTLERDFLYPELTGLFAASEALVSASQAHSRVVDKSLKSLVNVAIKQAGDTAAFDSRLRVVINAIAALFEQEEQHLLPKMRDFIRTEDREDLGLVFADAEAEVLAALDSDPEPVALRRKRA